MIRFPENLHQKLKNRLQDNSLRELSVRTKGVDFFSNDYLGFSKSTSIKTTVAKQFEEYGVENGSTGSRLISGTTALHLKVEEQLASFHKAESALLYNSGYDANIGLFSCVLQKGDVLLYDELIHASVRDGLKLSNAQTYKFKHNDVEDLENKIQRLQVQSSQLYIAVESVYSMDGDMAPLKEVVNICEKYNVLLIVDEAHSGGVFGSQGQGLVCALNLEDYIFARVHTFGKALGCHGAVVLGSKQLRNYLINFSRSFIYTTAIPPHAVLTISTAYQQLKSTSAIKTLKNNIAYFNLQLIKLNLSSYFIKSNSAIQCCIVKGNDNVKKLSNILNKKGMIVKAVLSPTVPKNSERIRICLHSYNNLQEIEELVCVISMFLIRLNKK